MNITDILGVSARFELLRLFRYRDAPIGIRPLSRLAGVHPYVVDRTLKKLVTEKMIYVVRAQGKPMYGKREDHKAWRTVKAVTDALDGVAAQESACSLTRRAGPMLDALAELMRVRSRAKRSLDVAE